MAESGFAPKQVRATGEFKDTTENSDTSAKRKPITAEESKALTYLQTLVQPSSENVGRKLLQLMGWRPGQGIGPRIPARRQTPGYNQAADDRLFDDIAAGKGVTFAPRDANVRAFIAKDNFHGVGYSGMSASDYSMTQRKPRAMGGIGTGAFEDLDDDIYDAEDDKKQYNRVLTTEQDEPKLKPTFRSKAERQLAIAGGQDSFSGPSRFALHGFVTSKGQVVPRKVYPGHRPPKDFNPFHSFKQPGPLSKGLISQRAMRDMTKMSARERAHLLGEQPPPLPPPAAMAPQHPPQSSSQLMQTPSSAPLAGKDKMTQLRKDAYRPFKGDPDKQQRYEAFLKGHRTRGRRQSTIEYEQELREFEQAKRLFKPLSQVMAMRFQPASSADTGDSGSLADEIKQLEEEKAQQEDEKAAAKMKMFGKLTRSTYEWHPHRMVSRRFNLPDPYPASGVVGIVMPDQDISAPRRHKTRWDQVGRVDAVTLAAAGLQQAAHKEITRQAQDQVQQHQQDVNAKFADVKQPEPRAKPLDSDLERAAIDAEAEEEEARMPKRPDVDLFKAIFSDDSDDEDDGDDNVEQPKNTMAKANPTQAADTLTLPVTSTPSTLPDQSGRPKDDKDPPATTALAHGKRSADKQADVQSHPQQQESSNQKESKKAKLTAAPAQPLSLQHFHPLATTAAVNVVDKGSKVQIKLAHLDDDDDDWEEVATGVVRSCLPSAAAHVLVSNLMSVWHDKRTVSSALYLQNENSKDPKKRKKHKKEKKSKKSKRHRRDRERSKPEVDDAVLLAKLKEVGGLNKLKRSHDGSSRSNRPTAADYM
eukprot:TRINITY_DN11671_c0_g2_i2.p1 TRINITY_DN11671_c0_g2~~TRINITY_DN11671_c0_g2_i2.p1  ORF type:complete len:925 (+),score=210.10 TRINITY_DN11671_c0_g2_i2:338-2776(+)